MKVCNYNLHSVVDLAYQIIIYTKTQKFITWTVSRGGSSVEHGYASAYPKIRRVV
jgi:hypothetical protein